MKHLQEIVEAAQARGKKRLAVAYGQDSHTIEAVYDAYNEGLVTPILYGDRITVDDRVFPFDTVGAVVVLGKNKVNLYYENEVLQLKGDKRFNALKYLHLYHRYISAPQAPSDHYPRNPYSQVAYPMHAARLYPTP